MKNMNNMNKPHRTGDYLAPRRIRANQWDLSAFLTQQWKAALERAVDPRSPMVSHAEFRIIPPGPTSYRDTGNYSHGTLDGYVRTSGHMVRVSLPDSIASRTCESDNDIGVLVAFILLKWENHKRKEG